MVRGTTPTFRLILDDEYVDLTQAVNVYASFKQKDTLITKSGEDIGIAEGEVDVYLSQAETLKFIKGDVEIQLNWTYLDGRRACSNIITIEVDKNLIGDVLA